VGLLEELVSFGRVVGVKAVGDAVTLEEVFELMRAWRPAVSYDADRRELGWACRLHPGAKQLTD
jgi:hypothetical protein